jgi:hypothetical protein
MPGRLQFTLETGRPAGAAHRGRGPMRLLVVGDFSARPVDCEYCDLKAVCRISERRLPEEKR